MTGARSAGGSRALLAEPAVARTFALAVLGRLAYGLLPLSLLFTLRQTTGSFTVAAAALAGFGLGALAMPLQSRLIDRHGQRRVLPACGVVFAVALVTIACSSVLELPGPVAVVAAWAAGPSAPALGPAMRAQWREITESGPRRSTAYSLDSVAEESLYLAGPLMAGVLLACGLAPVGLVLAAGLAGLGVAAMVTSPFVPSVARGSGAVGERTTSRSSPLRGRGLQTLVGALVLAGSAGAVGFIGLAGAADARGRPELAAWGETAIALGAVTGGLLWARYGRSEPWRGRLTLLLGLDCAAYAAASALSGSPVLVVAALALAASVMAPAFVVSFTAADTLAAPEERTEASTWVSTGFNAGNAAGSAAGGLLVAVGAAAPYVAASGAAGAATILLALRSRAHPIDHGIATVRCSDHDR